MLDMAPDLAHLLDRVMASSRVEARDTKFENSEEKRAGRASQCNDAKGWTLPGIVAKTRVTTNFGQVPAQLLRVGDRVRTKSGRFVPIRKIREIKLDSEFIERRPCALPVIIPEGSLGFGIPAQDVVLSPAQKITTPPGLLPEQELFAGDLIQRLQPLDQTLGVIAYYEIEFDEMEDVCCSGIWVRSNAPR